MKASDVMPPPEHMEQPALYIWSYGWDGDQQLGMSTLVFPDAIKDAAFDIVEYTVEEQKRRINEYPRLTGGPQTDVFVEWAWVDLAWEED